VLVLGVEVKPDGSLKDHRVLRDDSNLLTDFVQVDFADLNSINQNGASANLDNPSEGEAHGGLPTPGPANDTDLVSSLSFETKADKCLVKFRSVA